METRHLADDGCGRPPPASGRLSLDMRSRKQRHTTAGDRSGRDGIASAGRLLLGAESGRSREGREQ